MLRQQPNLGEVNYWALSAGSFRALEMFLFKLHAPRPFNRQTGPRSQLGVVVQVTVMGESGRDAVHCRPCKEVFTDVRLEDATGRNGRCAAKSWRQFDAWLEQKDALALFESNSADPELVVYASFRHTYIHAALVPVSKLDPVDVDDLLRWSCNPSETWGIWSTQSEVGITLPFDHPGSKTLTHAEQLVFTWRFDGHIGQKSYVEVLQKFTHIFDLHFVRERNAYCRIDKHGDVEEVIRIISMPSKREGWGNRLVTFNRRLLDEYMLVTKSALVRLFDVTRVDHDDFPGWGGPRHDSSGHRRLARAAYG